MEPSEALATAPRQPVPAEPLSWLDETAFPNSLEFDTDPRVEYVGRVRVPIAGPYRPWARLYRLPDQRLVWVVRLWEQYRAVRRLTSTAALLDYAQRSRLPCVAARIRALHRRGRSPV
jgi:hypothetical protein